VQRTEEVWRSEGRDPRIPSLHSRWWSMNNAMDHPLYIRCSEAGSDPQPLSTLCRTDKSLPLSGRKSLTPRSTGPLRGRHADYELLWFRIPQDHKLERSPSLCGNFSATCDEREVYTHKARLQTALSSGTIEQYDSDTDILYAYNTYGQTHTDGMDYTVMIRNKNPAKQIICMYSVFYEI